MTSYTIGRLELSSLRKNEDWRLRDSGTLVFSHDPPALTLTGDTKSVTLRPALIIALGQMAKPGQGSEGNEHTVEALLRGWRGIFTEQTGSEKVMGMTKNILGQVSEVLEGSLARRVSPLTQTKAPQAWRLTMAWEHWPTLPGLTREFQLKVAYSSRWI